MNVLNLKRCVQCGDLKSETQFRKYYGGRKGSYKTCLVCDKINNRYKYLSGKPKDTLSFNEEIELKKITQLYEVLQANNLKTPESKKVDSSILPDVSRLIELHTRSLANPTLYSEATLPDELYNWLHRDLEGMDPDDLAEVGDQLMAQYRPQMGLDAELQPIYDDKYRAVINQILSRFDDYEDEYYKECE